MPTVRRAERTQGITALPGVRMTAAETERSQGAELYQAEAQSQLAMADVGARVARVGVEQWTRAIDEEREAADRTALLEANNQIAAWKNAKLYDPETGVLLRKGKNAQGIPEELRGEYEKLTGEIAKNLHTDRQRNGFEALRLNEWQSIDLQTRRHVASEMQTYRAGELQSTVENAINGAIMSYSDPKLVAVELEKAIGAIKANAPGLGQGPEAIDKAIRTVQSKTHVGVISNLLADQTLDPDLAQEYFNAAKGQIDGEALDQVRGALAEGNVRKQAQSETARILGEGGTLAEQRAKAKTIENGAVQDEVLRRLEHEDSINERAELEAKRTSMTDAYNLLDKHKDVAVIPPMVWESFDGPTKSAMRGYADELLKGRPIQTDLTRWYGLVDLAAKNPTAFANKNLLEYKAVLSESDFQQLASWQLQTREGLKKGETPKELEGFRTNQQILNDTLVQNGVDPNAKFDSPQGKAVAQIRRMLDRKVQLIQSPTRDEQGKVTPGRKVTEVEIQAELDNIMSGTTTPEGQQPVSWWSLVRPFTYDWKDKSRRIIDYTISDVPLDARKGIEQDLKRQGIPISDTSVLDRFMEIELARSRGRR